MDLVIRNVNVRNAHSRNANLPGGRERVDIGIAGGTIAAIAPAVRPSAASLVSL